MVEGRWKLSFQAAWWRTLGKIGTYIHDLPPPKPAVPQFMRQVSLTNGHGTISLSFYVRNDYRDRMIGHRFPVIVNFHGGGFTLGTATDDGRWASVILQEVRAVFVSVEYRLAPEHPFPDAVEDGREALSYLANNAEGFGFDASQFILSGFSAGGNMTFTVPLKLKAYTESSKATPHNVPRVIGIISWYPILDYSISRDEKRAASVKPEKCLPKVFTDLFDASYLSNGDDKKSPFVSPALASDEMLVKALPDDIVLYLCEWDMLLDEGKRFAERLQGLGKRVSCTIIEEEKHAFDKMPALSINPKVVLHYKEACVRLNGILGPKTPNDETA